MNFSEGLSCTRFTLRNFDLAQTLDCGQCFRWKRDGDGFIGAAQGHAARISQNGDEITVYSNAPEQFWLDYFDAAADYEGMIASFSGVEQMKEPCRIAGGIRILRQDGWEAIASFILSQNNNIKRISGIIERLCENFGEQTDLGLYSFPPPERIAACTVEELAPLRCGFRVH